MDPQKGLLNLVLGGVVIIAFLSVAGGGLYLLGKSNKSLPFLNQVLPASYEGTISAKLTHELVPEPSTNINSINTTTNPSPSNNLNTIVSSTTIDLTKLPLGDKKISTSAKKGYIYSCQTQSDEAVGGAFQIGSWINQSAKTWDATKKLTVDGSIKWSNAKWSITESGSTRVLSGNGLPDHPTGVYPIATTDDAYQYDRNPNSIKEQTLSLSFPTIPTLLTVPECVGGEVGIMLSGIPLFNGFDATSRDANAYEIQDDCAGHPQVSGLYHYHGYSKCIKDDSSTTEHASLLGYAFDGFGIFGPKGENGVSLSTSDLDECHGHTHQIMWDGQAISMYHYHMSYDFPYSVGCFRGKKTVNGPLGKSNGSQTPTGQMNPAGKTPLNGPPPRR